MVTIFRFDHMIGENQQLVPLRHKKKFQATPIKQDLGNFGVLIKTFTTSNIVLLI